MNDVPTTERERDAIVRQYVRLFGRRPSEHELVLYQRAQARVGWRLPARARRRAALMITRL